MTASSSRGALVLAVVIASLSSPRMARAEEVFPGALQEAADMVCVPTCLMCHTTNPGTASSWATKAFPLALLATTKLKPGEADEEAFKAAYAQYAADPLHAEQVKLIKAGKDPQSGQDVCGPTYGCGASIAGQERGESSGSALALGALMLGLFVARRRH